MKKVLNWFRANFLSITTIALSLGILAAFLSTEYGLKNFMDAFSQIHFLWLVLIVVGVAAGWLLESFVLHLFCRHVDGGWTFGQSFYIGMAGLFYSALAPFNMGEPLEIYKMSHMGIDTGESTSIIAVKSLVHHVVMLFYSVFLISFELQYFQTKVSNFSFITLFGVITNGLFIFFVFLVILKERVADAILRAAVCLLDKLRLHKASKKLSRFGQEQLLTFHQTSKLFGHSSALYAVTALLTLMQITVNSLISYFVYRCFGLRGTSVFTMVAADTFVTMVASFVPLPGSSGGAEGGFYLFFQEFFGTRIVPGITLWRFSTYYLNILCGGIVTYAGRKRYKI